MKVLQPQNIAELFDFLKAKNYAIFGPTIRQDAIVYGPITSVKDLPIGWTEEQRPGAYRLKKREDQALFGYVPGPSSWKTFLFPPRQKLWKASQQGADIRIEKVPVKRQKKAFIGIRSCELQAIHIQDKVFLAGDYVNASYQERRKDILFIAVNCTQPGGTCFCASMGTGPQVKKDFDLCLTEIINKNEHYFVAQTASPQGEEILEKIKGSQAQPAHKDALQRGMKASSEKMGRSMDIRGVKELLYSHSQSPHWDKVAERCLSCANCTMVCPTCFCSTVEDVTDLTATHSERWEQWDSCFTQDFSYIHGGAIRQSTRSRYRQWITHKLASWQDQFGTSGCVGCGRCITWCPTGIDITEEIKQLQSAAGNAHLKEKGYVQGSAKSHDA